MNSIWNNIEKAEFGALDGNIKTDVCVIGGGLCGILCAYMLSKEGVDCVLVEAEKICAGITNGTTAKITVQHGLVYDKIIKKYGHKRASLYFESQKNGFDLLTELAKETEADLEMCDFFIYSLSNRDIIKREVEALKSVGCKAEFCKTTELPFDIAGAVKIEKQANFHPLKFAHSIAKKLEIYENTKVLEIKSKKVITNRGEITAKKIIVATHFPFVNKYGAYFMKMYQHRSYVVALGNAQKLSGMYVDEAQNGLSFRNYEDLLLLGGGGHRTGCCGGNWEELLRFAENYYPQAQVVDKWATQDCMTLDSVPYIGKYSEFTPDLFVATGFNKWGMTSSMVSAMIIKDMVLGKKNEYEKAYCPQRTIFHPQLAINIFESLNGLLSLKKPRCSHMGCALKYNKYEHSWDCSCHGSRFDEEGRILDNPAVKNSRI